MTNNKLLFLTNFTEACYQAIPTIAEWIDRERGHLTIVHVTRQEGRKAEGARERLQSFFAEADRYPHCERVLLHGRPADALVRYCRAQRPGIVFVPASKPSGLPRFLHQSLRASLIRRGGVKVWTRGRSDGTDLSPRTPRRVAYAITGHTEWMAEAFEAARWADAYGAQLHLLYLAPWPEVNDGTVAHVPLEDPHVSLDDVEILAQRLPGHPEIHTALGNDTRDLVHLLTECRADLAFVSENHAVRRWFFRERMDKVLDQLDCEVICFPKHPIARRELANPRSRQLEPMAAS